MHISCCCSFHSCKTFIGFPAISWFHTAPRDSDPRDSGLGQARWSEWRLYGRAGAAGWLAAARVGSSDPGNSLNRNCGPRHWNCGCPPPDPTTTAIGIAGPAVAIAGCAKPSESGRSIGPSDHILPHTCLGSSTERASAGFPARRLRERPCARAPECARSRASARASGSARRLPRPFGRRLPRRNMADPRLLERPSKGRHGPEHPRPPRGGGAGGG
jgi:hypothetical protein